MVVTDGFLQVALRIGMSVSCAVHSEGARETEEVGCSMALEVTGRWFHYHSISLPMSLVFHYT